MGVRSSLRVALVVALVTGVLGCAVSDPTRYYVLALAPAAPVTTRTADAGPAVTVGVGPVSIPGYLDRTQMVTRDGAGQVQISPYHQWAEPLDQGITRVLVEGLAARIPTDRVAAFPWGGSMQQVLQYQVLVTIMRFDGQPGGTVVLDTRWRLVSKGGQELVFKRSTVTEATGGAGYEPLAAAMSRALGTLGQEIAAEIRAQPAGSAATGR